MDTRRLLRKINLLTSWRWLALCLCVITLLPLSPTSFATDGADINIALTNEPPSLNSLQATDEISMFVLMHTQEGLLNYGPNNELVAGVASRWQLNADSAEFWLNPNARWCDGSKITADDFLFAWREVLKPSTASPYAFLLYPINNAREINRGLLPPDALGVSSDHPQHLRISLAQPTAYFLSLTTFPTFYPVKQAFYKSRAHRYGASPNDLLCNGAFKLTRWVHGANLELEANPLYWNSDNISLQKIRVTHITNDGNTLFNLFQSGDIAYAEITRDTLDQALQQRHKIHSFSRGSLSYLEFNLRDGYPTQDLALRRAIASIIDRQTLVNSVIADPGTKPALRFFPRWLTQVQSSDAIDVRISDQEFAALKAQLPNNLKLRFLIYDTPAVLRQAEYLQRELKQTLGIELVIDRQIFKQKLAKLKAGDFDLAISAWGPDYADPMTFAELLTSTNANNHGAFSNKEYDQLIAKAAVQLDGDERNQSFIKAHNILARELPVIPLTEPGLLYLQHPALNNIRRSRFGGDPDYRYATKDAAP